MLFLGMGRNVALLLFSPPKKFCPLHEEFPFLVYLSSRRLPSSLPRPVPATASLHSSVPSPARSGNVPRSRCELPRLRDGGRWRGEQGCRVCFFNEGAMPGEPGAQRCALGAAGGLPRPGGCSSWLPGLTSTQNLRLCKVPSLAIWIWLRQCASSCSERPSQSPGVLAGVLQYQRCTKASGDCPPTVTSRC